MENNIELFERYVASALSAQEKEAFDARLHTDREFALDFRVYLFTVRGLCLEAEQDNLEFGLAMQQISADGLLRAIGRRRRVLRLPWKWISTVAAMVVIGCVAVFNVHRADMNKLDNAIVAYNYIPESTRGWESLSAADIPALERAYNDAPADDVQACEDAGMRLAMAYLKTHDRKRAKALLRDLEVRFAADEEFTAQCRRILAQLD